MRRLRLLASMAVSSRNRVNAYWLSNTETIVMPVDKHKIATECYRKGTEAMTREHWDYAVDMYGKCVALVPDNFMYRQVLRGSERRKYKDNKTGAKMAGMKLMKIRGKIKKDKLKKEKDWTRIERSAEEGLEFNPWDAALNFELGTSCRELGYMEVAKFAFEEAVKNDPDNKAYNRTLALLLEERGEYSEAVSLWERIHKLDPLDSEARSKVTQLEAKTVIERGGYEDADNIRDVHQQNAYDLDRPAKSSMPQAVDGPGVSIEADLQRAIRKDESSTENYLKLAEFYKREKRLEEAAATLQTALEVSGGDQNIREEVENVEIDQLKRNLELAKEAVRSNGEDKMARKNASALAKELLQREIGIFNSRIERYPQDSRLKFDLAQRYMRTKKWSEAIPLLQQASADSRLECDVLVALGECFINDKKESLGRRQFEKASEKVNQHDRPDLFLKTHYVLGRLCEKAGQRDKAEDHYNEVLAVEYGYRDTLKRLEGLQAGDEEGEQVPTG